MLKWQLKFWSRKIGGSCTVTINLRMVVGCTQTVLWQTDKWKLFRRRTQGRAGRQPRLIWCWPYLCWHYYCTDRKESTVRNTEPILFSRMGLASKHDYSTLKYLTVFSIHKVRSCCHRRYASTISVLLEKQEGKGLCIVDFNWLVYFYNILYINIVYIIFTQTYKNIYTNRTKPYLSSCSSQKCLS